MKGKPLKLKFLNTKRGKYFGKVMEFEEPIDYLAIYATLDPTGYGEEALDNWLLSGIEGEKALVEACFSGCEGKCVTELRRFLDFAEAIFSEYESESWLSILAQAANLLGADIEQFIWSGWVTSVGVDEVEDFLFIMSDLYPESDWDRMIEEEIIPSSKDIRDYLKSHPKVGIVVGDQIVLLQQK